MVFVLNSVVIDSSIGLLNSEWNLSDFFLDGKFGFKIRCILEYRFFVKVKN